MTNAEHEDLVNAGRRHLSRYTIRPDADDVIEEYKAMVRRRLELTQHERSTER